MPFDKLKYPEELLEDRRKAVRASLRPISIDELVGLLREHDEEFIGNPARDEFQRLMEQRPAPNFYCALPQEDVVVYYCRDADFGVWVLAGSGMGPLDATGKRLMKEAIEAFLRGGNVGGKR